MKIYLAAIYSSKAATKTHAEFLRAEGHEITSSWLDMAEARTPGSKAFEAQLDLYDIDRADVVILFTLPIGTTFTSGGRMVEFGYAIAKKKPLIIVGERENIFCHLTEVRSVASIDEAAELLRAK